MCKPKGNRIILRTGKLNRSQRSADPEGRGQGVRTPWKITQVIWVSIGSKQLPPSPPPPPLEKFGPPPEP